MPVILGNRNFQPFIVMFTKLVILLMEPQKFMVL